MIQISERIVVDASPDAVWAVMSDPAEVAPCIPGCTLGHQISDDVFDASMRVKFGAIAVTFKVELGFRLRENELCGDITIRGADKRGGTRVSGGGVFSVSEIQRASAVTVDGSITVAGALASIVEAGAAIVVKRLVAQFTERLVDRIESSSPEMTAPGAFPTTLSSEDDPDRESEDLPPVSGDTPLPDDATGSTRNRWAKTLDAVVPHRRRVTRATSGQER